MSLSIRTLGTTMARFLDVLSIILLFSSQLFCQDSEILDTVDEPKNINDCIELINMQLNDSLKSVIKSWPEDEFVANVHMGYGLNLRNRWGLWGDSRLSKYFNDLGIFHPDDMLGIILTSYYRHLIQRELQLDTQVNYYKLYWLAIEPPSKEDRPTGLKDVEFGSARYYHLAKDNKPGFLHFQTNSKTDSTWIYDYHFGWKNLSIQQLEYIESIKSGSLEIVLTDIFSENG